MAATFLNWNKSVESHPTKVFYAHTVDDLIAVVRDPATYPSPVRVAGHLHSMTGCFATTGSPHSKTDHPTTKGTQVFLADEFTTKLQMNDDGTLTVGGGVTMLCIAKFLEPLKLQLAVMPEVGNATAGSIACCGTKDSSFTTTTSKGPSQVSSTVVAVKMVTADGAVEYVDAWKNHAEADRMRLIRSSYGLLGIIYEVTFKTEPLTLARYSYEVLKWEKDNSVPSLAKLRNGANSVLGFMQPYDKQILVERRTLVDPGTRDSRSIDELARCEARRIIWRCKAATLAKIISDGVAKTTSLASRLFKTVGFPVVETELDSLLASKLLHVTNETMADSLQDLLDDFRASRADCMLDFPKEEPYFDFTFWAFPESKWETIVPRYLEFVHNYKQDSQGFQKSLFTEIYLISQDNASFLTFSPDEDIFTLDMVHHDANDQQWKKMNQQFNVFAANNGGLPLLNQTKELTTSPQGNGPSVVRATLGERWEEFLNTVHAEDPNGRFMNDFFQNL